EILNKRESTPKLFVAAIDGHCVGGGLEIAMATDLRLASDGAWRVGLPEVTLGVLPGTGGTQRLPRLVGKSRAIDLMATGRMITPKEALDWGLFNRVFPRAKFWEETMAFAKGLGYPQHSGRAVGFIKRSVTEGTEMPLYEGLALERELQNRLFAMADAKEGFRAFLEKRAPKFQGKSSEDQAGPRFVMRRPDQPYSRLTSRRGLKLVHGLARWPRCNSRPSSSSPAIRRRSSR